MFLNPSLFLLPQFCQRARLLSLLCNWQILIVICFDFLFVPVVTELVYSHINYSHDVFDSVSFPYPAILVIIYDSLKPPNFYEYFHGEV